MANTLDANAMLYRGKERKNSLLEKGGEEAGVLVFKKKYNHESEHHHQSPS